MHIQQLKIEVDALKKEVRELKALGADKVLIATVEDMDKRLTAVERFIGKQHVTSKDDKSKDDKGKAGN